VAFNRGFYLISCRKGGNNIRSVIIALIFL
jgi:hypothetical protein